MTNEEIKAGIDALRFTMDMLLFDPGTGQTKEASELNELDKITYDGCVAGITALEKVERYKWHDLRKNPDDLPENFQTVIICLKGFEGKQIGISLAMHSKQTKLWGSETFSYKEHEVIAWREIEPFEVE